MKKTNACGSDGITFKFIIDALYVLAFYITIIINTSIVTKCYPQQWKNPIVLPTFKGGDRNAITNYRPISLLPILSKILEKIVANQLSRYLEINNLISINSSKLVGLG